MALEFGARIDTTSKVEHTTYQHESSDSAAQAYLICCEKLNYLETRVEELVARAEQRSQTLHRLQRLKQMILKSPDTMTEDEISDEMREILEQARSEGLELPELAWSNSEEKAGIIDEIQLHMGTIEAKNIPDRSYMSLFMSQRTEISNLFSKILSDHHNTLVRMAQKLTAGAR
mgnify:CR=1 FL=1